MCERKECSKEGALRTGIRHRRTPAFYSEREAGVHGVLDLARRLPYRATFGSPAGERPKRDAALTMRRLCTRAR